MAVTKPTSIYLDGLSDLCKSAENQISRLVGHSGEKGRLLEESLRTVLRRFLPRKYELGSGFIVDAMGDLSSQTDIIVYDNQLNSPIVTESSSILFPIECVYAAIEVKKRFQVNELGKIVADIAKIRALAKSKRYIEYTPTEKEPGRFVTSTRVREISLSPRTYVFTYSTTVASIDTVATRAATALSNRPAHLHGLYVLGKKWLVCQKPHESNVVLNTKADAALADFLRLLLTGVSSLPMGQMDLDPYLDR